MKKFLFGIVLVLAGCGGSPSLPVVTVDDEVIDEAPVVERVSVDPCEDVERVSFHYLICHPIEGKDFEILFVEAQNDSYVRYAAQYSGPEFTISGVLLVPRGEGPFPLVLTNHGYIDVSVYTRGRGLKREQHALARAGFAVFHPDYRNHAESDDDPDYQTNFRIGYVEDVIAAIKAIRDSELPELETVDATRVGMIGHSMGGGVSMGVAVVEPDLVDAVVLYAPVSSDARDNLQRYFLRDGEDSERVQLIYERHGSPQENPAFWDGMSSQLLFDRIDDPVQIHIGTADESVEVDWSETIRDEMEAEGVEVDFQVYENAPHEFIRNWPLFSERFVNFFTTHL